MLAHPPPISRPLSINNTSGWFVWGIVAVYLPSISYNLEPKTPSIRGVRMIKRSSAPFLKYKMKTNFLPVWSINLLNYSSIIDSHNIVETPSDIIGVRVGNTYFSALDNDTNRLFLFIVTDSHHICSFLDPFLPIIALHVRMCLKLVVSGFLTQHVERSFIKIVKKNYASQKQLSRTLSIRETIYRFCHFFDYAQVSVPAKKTNLSTSIC